MPDLLDRRETERISDVLEVKSHNVQEVNWEAFHFISVNLLGPDDKYRSEFQFEYVEQRGLFGSEFVLQSAIILPDGRPIRKDVFKKQVRNYVEGHPYFEEDN